MHRKKEMNRKKSRIRMKQSLRLAQQCYLPTAATTTFSFGLLFLVFSIIHSLCTRSGASSRKLNLDITLNLVSLTRSQGTDGNDNKPTGCCKGSINPTIVAHKNISRVVSLICGDAVPNIVFKCHSFFFMIGSST